MNVCISLRRKKLSSKNDQADFSFKRQHEVMTRVFKYQLLVLLIAVILGDVRVPAQSTSASQARPPQDESPTTKDSQSDEKPDESDTATTIFPHSEKSRFWISGQINIISQWHPSFPAKYSGDNSLKSTA